jgi:ribonuclease D
VAAVTAQPSHEPRADDFWRIKGAGDLIPRSQAVLRELYLFREREARRRDWPPFKIMGDKTLLALAQTKPYRLHDLDHFIGMTPLQIKRYGEGVIDAVTRGLSAPTPRAPRNSPPDYGALNRYEKLRAWRRQVAAERGVEPDVVVCNAVLMAVAHGQPSTLQDLESIEGLGPWKLRTYGKQLVEALK